ncbi:AP endonuclease [Dissulfurispira thermophila]|uniref:AP endonuclease n=2 Tax=root TaxID=1 RepID=A0A7G1H1L6_9BACT|nr:sugar phosphate isomerase/epimerase family protein [Dissulfurispira thermophila]BCB96122.1 AP endonuclease [Dissulfurispira thermophila]
MLSPHIHVPYEKIGDYIQFIKQNKLNLEIYFNSNALDSIDTDSILKLKDILDYNPSLSFHAPFMDLSPGAIDSKVRNATIERFTHILDISEILKPKTIVFHSGYEKWKYALKIDLWLGKSIETWKPLNDRAKNLGIKIAIENIFEDEPTNLKMLVESINSDNFGICFDAGHCNLFSKVSLKEWLKAIKPYIIELHLHDNNKSADQHLSIGEGNFDFQTLFSELKNNNCIYTIEAHTKENVLKSIERIKGYIQQGIVIS